MGGLALGLGIVFLTVQPVQPEVHATETIAEPTPVVDSFRVNEARHQRSPHQRLLAQRSRPILETGIGQARHGSVTSQLGRLQNFDTQFPLRSSPRNKPRGLECLNDDSLSDGNYHPAHRCRGARLDRLVYAPRLARRGLLAVMLVGFLFWIRLLAHRRWFAHIRRSLTDRFIGGYIHHSSMAWPCRSQADAGGRLGSDRVSRSAACSARCRTIGTIATIQPMAHLVLYWFLPAMMYWIARQSPP